MRAGRKTTESSWPKVLVRKWFNMKDGCDEFHSDHSTSGRVDRGERRRSCSDEGSNVVVPEELTEGWLMEANGLTEGQRFEEDVTAVTRSLNLRMFVGTWNVGGKSPHDGLNLSDWLRTPDPADIYVLGFQEIVPLNAGNVLGAEDSEPAAKWLSLICQALNCNDPSNDPQNAHFDSNTPKHESNQQPSQKSRVSFSDLLSLGDDFERFLSLNYKNLNASSEEDTPSASASPPNSSSRYCLAASKQMVGVFLCVWVRADLHHHVNNLKVSCVGRGIMGYLGNKGSVSISMTLHRITFCFVCTHLASGEKEGDEIKRNCDVMEILKKTRFSHSCRLPGRPAPPDSILDHDNIIWLGDLNYRLASSCGDIYELLEKSDWQALLEKDQLRIEQRAGRVFNGWEEGRIYFAPTYKYHANSDHYVVHTSASKEKRRTPAWCDRILWKGEGLKQMWYMRGESKFSDHRPVYSIFSVLVNVAKDSKKPLASRSMAATAKTASSSITKATTGLSSTCVDNVQAELLLLTRAQSCI